MSTVSINHDAVHIDIEWNRTAYGGEQGMEHYLGVLHASTALWSAISGRHARNLPSTAVIYTDE
jgi:hypothetical protein